MTNQKKETKKDPIQSGFEALPLDQKFASLLKMEAVTITEAFNYVVESSSKAFEKAGEVINDFGAKFEKEARKATESATGKKTASAPKASAAKPKSRPAKKAPNAGAAK